MHGSIMWFGIIVLEVTLLMELSTLLLPRTEKGSS